MNDATHSFTSPSIFGLLTKHNLGWSIYGYSQAPKTRLDFTDTTNASESHFGVFTDFTAAAAAGTLPPYTFLEPSWESTGNSQHPNYDVALGEQLIHDVYYALRKSPAWNQTLLILTYDEHGGCYDHVAPPGGAAPPDATVGQFGFDFKRFGLRVPTVLVSPLIAAGTVFRVAQDATPLDHTSILKTVETRWGLPALTARDAAAVDVGDVLTLSVPRTDDPLAGVIVPTSTGANPSAALPSHLQRMYAEQLRRWELRIRDSRGAKISNRMTIIAPISPGGSPAGGHRRRHRPDADRKPHCGRGVQWVSMPALASPSGAGLTGESRGCCMMTSSATRKPKMTVKKSIVNPVV